MSRDQLLEKMLALVAETAAGISIKGGQLPHRIEGRHPDPEQAHVEADALLLDFVKSNFPELAAAYEAVSPKWYA